MSNTDFNPPDQPPDTLPVGGKTQGQLLPTEHVDPLSPEAYQRVVSGETALYKKHADEQDRLERGESDAFQAYQVRQERMLHAEGVTADDMQPWNPQLMAPPPANLWEKFGSPGFIIGMLASSFTAMPMVSALNAGAAAMNAINEGDNENYHRAFDTWKVNSELAIKRFNMEKDAFDQIAHLQKSSMEEWHAKATALAARFNDERMQVMLQNGMYPDGIKNQEALATSMTAVTKVQKELADNNTQMAVFNATIKDENGRLKPEYAKDPKKMADAWRTAKEATKDETTPIGVAMQELRLSPEWEKAGSAEREKMIDERVRGVNFGRGAYSAGAENVKDREAIKADERAKDPKATEGQIAERTNKRIAESKTVVTANKRLDEDAHIRQYKLGIELVDKVTDVLDQYASAAGLAGRATRLKERVTNIFGSNDTDRVQMMRDIEELQLMGPRLLLDQRTGRPLSAEAGHINDIIAGLNMGDTTANTLRAMQEIRDRFDELLQGNIKSLDRGKTETTAPPTEKPESRPWENDPVTHD